MNATIKFVVGHKPLSNGKYTIYLQIIKNRKRKKISIGLRCIKKDFESELFTKKHPNYQLENEILSNLKSRALKIIREFQAEGIDFSLRDFERKFRNKGSTEGTRLLEFFDILIDEMKKAGRMGNAKAYSDTKTSVAKYCHKAFTLNEINLEFLEKYEVFLRETGSTNGGVGFRMRILKAVYNRAVKRGYLPNNKAYPFKHYSLSKLKSKGNKIALSIDDFKKFKEVNLENNPQLLEAYNYFMFSFFTRGMNFHDMMLLRWKNISEGRIKYTRSKTKGVLNIKVLGKAQEILDFYKNEGNPNDYVFPILLKENMTPQQIANRKHKVLSRYNKKLKEIARLANVRDDISSYTARHSFATILKKKGGSIEVISEMMGHSDVKVTMSYLKDFDNEVLDEENNKLLDL